MTKVIIFCALLYCSNFVASTPSSVDSVRQRAYLSNSWQGNENNAGQYHGTDSNFNSNSGSQHSRGSNFHMQRSSIQSLPSRINERQINDFTLESETFPVRDNAQAVRPVNQFGQQNWQSRNRFISPSSGVVNTDPASYQRFIKVEPEPFRTGQQIPLQRPSQQHDQVDNSYHGTRDLHYHYVREKPGVHKFVAQSGFKTGPHIGTTHFENDHEARVHSANVAQSGGNTFGKMPPIYTGPDKTPNFEEYNHPENKKYVPNLYNKFPSPDVFPTRTGIKKRNDENVGMPILTTGSNNQGLNTYAVPNTPIEPVIYTTHTRYWNNPVINSEPDNRPHKYTALYSGLPNRGSVNDYNDKVSLLPDTKESKRENVKLRNDNEEPLLPIDTTTAEDNKSPVEASRGSVYDSKSPESFGEEKPNENVYHFSVGENAKEYFLNKIKKNFVIIHANGTVEYVNHLNTENSPSYVVVKKKYKPPTSFQPTPNNFHPDDRTDDLWSGSSNNNNDNQNDSRHSQQETKSHADNDDDSSPIRQLQTNQRPTVSSLPQSIEVNDYKPPSEANDYNSPLKQQKLEDNYNWVSGQNGNRYRQNNSNWEKHHLRVSHPHTTTSTTPTPGAAMIEKLLDSDDDTLTLNNNTEIVDSTDTDYNPYVYRHLTTPSSKLHTKLSSDVFRSISTTPDYHANNSNWQNKQRVHHPINSSHALYPAESTTTIPSPNDEAIEKFEDSPNNAEDEHPLATDDQYEKPKKTGHPAHNNKLHMKISATPIPTRNDYHQNNTNWEIKQTISQIKQSVQANDTGTSTTPTPDGDLVGNIEDSPSNTYENGPSSNDNEYDKSKKTELPCDDDYHPHHAHKQTTASSKLNTKISPGIFRSTTLSAIDKDNSPHNSKGDNKNSEATSKSKSHKNTSSSSTNDGNLKKILASLFDKNDDKSSKYDNQHESSDDNYYLNSHTHSHKTSLKLHTNISTDIEDELADSQTLSKDYSTTDARIVPNLPTDSTAVDQIITLSSIELATDDLSDDSTQNTVNEAISENYNLDIIKDLSVVDEVTKSYYSSRTNSDNPVVLENIDDTDDRLIQIIDGNNKDETVEIIEDLIKNNAESAFKDSNSLSDDPANSDDNTETPLYQSGENKDGTSSGNENTSSDEKTSTSVQRENNSDINLVKESNDNKKNHINYDETAVNKSMMLDLSDALVVMNKTQDKEYLNQLLSGDSRVNLFIFQMPSQEQALIERSKETIIFANGTCVEETTETTWKNRDDPTPTVITTRKYYGGGKCHH